MEGTPTVSQELDFGPKPTPPLAQGKKKPPALLLSAWSTNYVNFFWLGLS